MSNLPDIQHVDLNAPLEDRKRAVIVARGSLDSETVTQDSVSWCIRNLEIAGIHPTLPAIIEILGRGSQSTVLPMIRQHYARMASERRTFAPISARGAPRYRESLIAYDAALRREIHDEMLEGYAEKDVEIRARQQHVESLERLADQRVKQAADREAAANESLQLMQANVESLQKSMLREARENAQLKAELAGALDDVKRALEERDRWHRHAIFVAATKPPGG
jgi:hypothetical protein